jgi:sporulation protein YqfC
MARKDADKKENMRKTGIKEKIISALELPKDLILDIPRMTIVGNRDILLENYKNILEFSCEQIRVATGLGVIRISGENMQIREITCDNIAVSGEITGIEFIDANAAK